MFPELMSLESGYLIVYVSNAAEDPTLKLNAHPPLSSPRLENHPLINALYLLKA